MLKRLHNYVIKLYLGPLILTFFISMFVLLMQFLWKYVDDLVGKGLDISIILELLFYASARLVPMALPLAILISSIMTFGNLGEKNELLAMKSSGISLQRIMFPLIVLIIAISIGAFYFSNYALPYTNLKVGSLLWDIKHQRPELNIKEGIFNNDVEGYRIRVEKKNKDNNMMYDFIIYDHTKGRENTNVTIADSATMYITEDTTYMILTMYSGHSYEEMRKYDRRNKAEYPHQRIAFEEQTAILELVGFRFERTDADLFKNNYQMLNLSQLDNAIDSLYNVVYHRKDNFGRNLLRTNFYKHSRHIPRINNNNRYKPKPVKRNKKDTVEKEKSDERHSDTTEKEKNYEQKLKNAHHRTAAEDSLFYESINEDIIIVNLDSAYNDFNIRQKQDVLTGALRNARSSKSYIDQVKNDVMSRIKHVKKHEVEWHRKFTLAFACFIFFFIGAPLGAIIRKGGLGIPVVISVVLFIIYYIVSNTGEKFVREAVLDASVGMWISSFILLPIGVFLTYKAAHDSVILNIETYLNVFKRLAKRISP